MVGVINPFHSQHLGLQRVKLRCECKGTFFPQVVGGLALPFLWITSLSPCGSTILVFVGRLDQRRPQRDAPLHLRSCWDWRP